MESKVCLHEAAELRDGRSRWGWVAVALVILLLAGPALAGGDWNDAEIDWKAYEDGLAQAKEKGKPICLVFYTEWCPHCKNYSRVFHDPKIVEKSKAFVMVRLDKDSNRTLSADEALEWGLVNRVVPADDLAAESEKLAARLASGPTTAFGLLKKLVASSFGDNLEAQMELESRAIADSARTADALEGIDAFFAKRRPKFTGN